MSAVTQPGARRPSLVRRVPDPLILLACDLLQFIRAFPGCRRWVLNRSTNL